MKKDSMSFIISILFIIFGIIIFFKPGAVIDFASYLLGGIFVLVGLYKCLNYYIKDKNLKVVNHYELAFGITAIILGVLFVLLADTLLILFKIFVGAWLIIRGLGYVMQTFFTTNRDKKFIILIVTGLIIIGLGLFVILRMDFKEDFKFIGLFMVLYGLIDFISYFVYKDNDVIDDTPELINKVDAIDMQEKTENSDVYEVELEEPTKKKKKAKKGSKK